MKSVAFAILCFAACIALAYSSSCCESRSYVGSQSECTESKCKSVFSDLTKQQPSVEFYDSCRMDHTNSLDFIEELTGCGQSLINRGEYLSTLADIEELLADDSDDSGLPMRRRGNEAYINAVFTLSYGCIREAKTSRCRSLQTYLRPKDGLLGYVPANVSDEVFSGVSLTLPNLIKSCTRFTGNDTETAPEWEGGIASCFAVGTRTNQVSLSDYVNQEGDCSQCDIRIASDLPYCVGSFSTTQTIRYGAHCSSHQDRIAKSFVDMWTATGKARLGATPVSFNNASTTCLNFLRDLACQTTMGHCSSQNSRSFMCRSVCEYELTANCQLNNTEAETACQALAANRTAGCAPEKPATSTTIPDELRQETVNRTSRLSSYSNVTLERSGTSQRNFADINICLSVSNQNSSNVRIVFDGLMANLCPSCSLIGASCTNTPACTDNCTIRFGPLPEQNSLGIIQTMEAGIRRSLKPSSPIASSLQVSQSTVDDVVLSEASTSTGNTGTGNGNTGNGNTGNGNGSGAGILSASLLLISAAAASALF